MLTRLQVVQLELRDVPAAFQYLPELPFADLAVMDHARALVARGQLLGRQSNVVLKLGDSNSSVVGWPAPTFLMPLGTPGYNPNTSGLAATHQELLDTWNAIRWSTNAFAYEGPGAYPGWTSAKVLQAVAGQVDATDAGIALVMIGTNDVLTGVSAAQYRDQLTAIVETLLTQGVLPVLSTIPDIQYQGGTYRAAEVQFNQVIADVAERFEVPLWNVWASLGTLPNDGLSSDGVHLTTSPSGGGSFWSADLLYGQNVRNLQALQILDWFRESIVGGFTYVAPEPTWQEMSDTRSLYAVGRDLGMSSTVDVYDADPSELVNRFLAFGPTFSGGVRVATGDVNGDGFTDIICATASGSGVVKAFSGLDGSVLMRETPFGTRFHGGLTVATGDLDGDGIAEIVLGREGNGSGVRVYSGNTFEQISAFRAFPSFNARGVSVAVAEVEGLGSVIAVGATGTGPSVRLFDLTGQVLAGHRAYDSWGFGITLAAVDLDGDGFDELAVTPSAGSARVRILDAESGTSIFGFVAGVVVDSAFGLRLGTLRSEDGTESLLVGNAPGASVAVRVFDDLSGVAAFLPPERDARAFGIFVG